MFGRHYIPQNNIGFSLLELVIVLTLSVFLLLSIIISYRQWIIHQQLNATVNQLSDTLEFARDCAIALQTTIVFEPKNANWDQGQLIVVKNNQRELRELPAINKNFQLSWRSTLGESKNLQFRRNGFTRGQQGSFLLQLISNPTVSAQLIILRTGRIRVVMHAG